MTHWDYGVNRGPEQWSCLSSTFKICDEGKRQSPIDIDTKAAVEAELPPLQFHYQASLPTLIHTGNTIQVKLETENHIELTGTRYDFDHFHFHAPAEHTLDKEAPALELHIVHKSENGAFLVLGIFIKNGAENTALAPLWSKLPVKSGDTNSLLSPFHLQDILPAGTRSYRYPGSLTTPPCSETVDWILLADCITMSEQQISIFQELFAGGNARPVQLLNGRIVQHG